MPTKLPNSRPAVPQDFSAFEAPATLLGMIGCDNIEGYWREITWSISKGTHGAWCVRFSIDGKKSWIVADSLPQAFQLVYVTGIRLGRE